MENNPPPTKSNDSSASEDGLKVGPSPSEMLEAGLAHKFEILGLLSLQHYQREIRVKRRILMRTLEAEGYGREESDGKRKSDEKTESEEKEESDEDRQSYMALREFYLRNNESRLEMDPVHANATALAKEIDQYCECVLSRLKLY